MEESTETEEELKPDIPEGYSFGGRDFTILHNNYPPAVGWTQYDIDAEEINGTTINDAVYNRNSRVEADYDCVIVGDKVDYGTLHSRIPTLVRADDDSVDIATPLFWCGNLSNMTLEGFFLDMNTIDSMNLKQPWYDQQSVEAFTIFDKIYSVVSDMTIGAQIATAGMVFNKQLYEDYQYSTNYGNIYDIVREGKWTHQMMSDMVLALTQDVDNDGKYTDEDFYGLLYQRDSLPSFINSYDMYCAQKDDSGVPIYTLVNEANSTKLDALFDTLYQEKNCFHVMNWFDPLGQDFTIGMTNMFSANQAMFMWIRFADVESLRSMEVDFGIIPVPKWDEAQKQYYSTVNQHMGIATVIPVTNNDAEATGYLIEALSCESKKQLIPAYYDVLLQGKVARDEESLEMLDIIFDNRVYDTGFIFNIGGFGQAVYALTQTTLKRDYNNVWVKGQRAYTRTMDRFVKDWQEIGAEE